jgi:hypothetical protein
MIQSASHIKKIVRLLVDPNVLPQCSNQLCKRIVVIVRNIDLESNKGTNNIESDQNTKVDFDKDFDSDDVHNEELEEKSSESLEDENITKEMFCLGLFIS